MRNLDELLSAVLSGGPIEEIMRASEREAGHRVIVPGDEPWLSEDDWPTHSVISVDGKRVRIIAIMANNPGQGSFRRLVDGIIQAGLVPCVVAPLDHMKAILKRWEWKHRFIGKGWERQELWEPRRKHLQRTSRRGR